MATAPNFASIPKLGAVTTAVANAARDGSGTLSTVITGVAAGTRIDNITIKATGTTTAGMVRLYLHNGTAAFLWREILIPAIIPSGILGTFEQQIDCSVPGNLLFLPSGQSLRFAPSNAEGFNVIAIGADG